MTPAEAKTLADAWLTKTRGEPCAVFDWSAREARTHWRFFWNTVEAFEGRADALKGVDAVAVDKRTGEVHFDRKPAPPSPVNELFPPRPPGAVSFPEAAKELAQGWLDATSEHWCSITETIELTYGWAFIYNSDEYLRTGDFLHSLVGHGPLVVIAESGDLHALGGARPVEVTLAEFAKSRRQQK